MLKMKRVVSVVLVFLIMLVSFPVYALADSENSQIVEYLVTENAERIKEEEVTEELLLPEAAEGKETTEPSAGTEEDVAELENEEASDGSDKVNVIDLYRREGSMAIIGETFMVNSNAGQIKADSVLVYELEDGATASFKAVESVVRAGYYYFDIEPKEAGYWKAVTFDGIPLEIPSLNFTCYSSLEEFEAAALEQRKNNSQPESLSRAGSLIRYSGADRYITAVNLSKATFASTTTVILTSGSTYHDALSAVNLAKIHDGPILLSEANALNANTRAEIARLGANRVRVVGGPASISETVLSALRTIPGVNSVERISGSTGPATAVAVAEHSHSIRPSTTAIVVSGDNYADALSAGALSGARNYPILYVRGTALDNVTRGFVSNNISSVILVGGSTSVSPTIESSLRSMGKAVTRVSGADRYETSRKVATNYFPSATSLYIAAGTNFADALAGGVTAAKSNVPIVLVTGSTVHENLNRYIAEKRITRGFIIGGINSVTSAQESAFQKSLTNSQMRIDLTNEAKQQLGKPYVWGAAGPNSFDCSGLTKYLYSRSANIALPHHTISQSVIGKTVDRSELLPGDLIFFAFNDEKPGVVSHVGIYMGNNMMIHAPDENRVVEYANITLSGYVNSYIRSKNILD